MLRINKKLTIKFKLATSVFETINKAAYATQSRALGTVSNVANSILAHETFCDFILPLIIGNNKNNSEWEQQKYNFISSKQIAIPATGLNLDLNRTFDRESLVHKPFIDKYIEDYKQYTIVEPTGTETKSKKVINSDKDIVNHILANIAITPIDYHQYFKFDNHQDYLYWVIAVNSSSVSNTTDDINKSPNIRFFLYDEKISKGREMTSAKLELEAINKLNTLKLQDGGEDLISSICIIKNVLTFDEMDESDDNFEDIYLAVFRYAKEHSADFLAIAEDKDLKVQSQIKKYINQGILRISDNNEIVETANTSNILGRDLLDTVKYFNNPLNKAEVTKYLNQYKSLRK